MCRDALLIVVGENQENGSHVSSQLNVSTDWTHQIGDCSLKRFYTADCGGDCSGKNSQSARFLRHDHSCHIGCTPWHNVPSLSRGIAGVADDHTGCRGATTSRPG